MGYRISRREFTRLLAGLPFLPMAGESLSNDPLRRGTSISAPNILILVFDALSAKHLSLHGYPRRTTPNLDRFAEQATVFHAHYSAGSYTTPGVASLFTGVYPWTHRALNLHGTVAHPYEDRNLFSAFGPAGYHRVGFSHNLFVTSLMYQARRHLDLLIPARELCLSDDELADRLFPHDYNVAFWSEWILMRKGYSPPVSLFISLLDRVRRPRRQAVLEAEHRASFPRGLPTMHNLYFILEEAIDYILESTAQSPQPYLAYYHLLPPHEPYTARREFVGLFDDGWAPEPLPPGAFSGGHTQETLNRKRVEYDEYVAYVDAEFGRLIDTMSRTGALDNTMLIVTSDHGELFERGIAGHMTPALYDSLIRVPLIISRPGQRRRRDIHTPTSSVDLLPTLLQASGQEAPDWCEGRVLPSFGPETNAGDRSLFVVEAKSNPKMAPLTKASIALINGSRKLIHYLGYPECPDSWELYDLTDDPGERHNQYSPSDPVAETLRSELEYRVNQATVALSEQ